MILGLALPLISLLQPSPQITVEINAVQHQIYMLIQMDTLLNVVNYSVSKSANIRAIPPRMEMN